MVVESGTSLGRSSARGARAWLGLWMRVYVLCLLAYVPVAAAGLIYLGVNGVGAVGVLMYAALAVPVGFGAALVASAPVTAVWGLLAVMLGWRLVPEGPVDPPPRCPRCRYNISGVVGDVCPECGVRFRVDPDDDEPVGRLNGVR